MFRGQKPDVTPAQAIAVLIAGVPVIATLLHTFGVYDMTVEQQQALSKTLEWAGILAVGLFGADAGLRAARNHATARIEVAKLPGPTPALAVAGGGAAPLATLDDLHDAAELPSDHEEFNGHNEIEPTLPTDDEEFADVDPDDDAGPDSRLRAVADEEGLL